MDGVGCFMTMIKAEETDAIRARLREIDLEQRSRSEAASSNILTRYAGELNAEYEARMAALRSEQIELRTLLRLHAPEGMASGQRLVIYRGLGTLTLHDDTEPEYAEVRVPRDEWDWSES